MLPLLTATPPTGYPTRGLVAFYDLMQDNLLLQSQTFDNASWTKTRSYIATNCAADPYTGAYTVDKLVEDGTASATHFTRQTVVTTAGPYTKRVVVAAAGRNVALLLHDGTAIRLDVAVNLATFAVSASTGTATAVADGAYVVITLVSTECLAGTGYLDIYLHTGTSGAYSGLGHRGTAAAGGSATTAVLAAGASAVDDIYTHYFAAASANKNLMWPKSASDFSNGWLSGWVAGGTATVTYDAANGVASGGCMKLVGAAANNYARSMVIPSYTPVTENLAYSVSASMKGGAGSETVAFVIAWYTAAHSLIGVSATGPTRTLTTDHARYVYDNVTAPATAAWAAVRVIQVGAGTPTVYVDEVQFEQAAAATAYIAPTQGALWSDAGSKGTFSDAPTVEHSATGYKGNTKQLTFTPARTAVPDGTTYTVGPGIYIARAQLNPGTTARDYQVNTDMQSQASLFNLAPTLQRGATSGAEASDGSWGASGYVAATDDYLKSVALTGVTLSGPWTLVAVGIFSGAAGGVVALAADATNQIYLTQTSTTVHVTDTDSGGSSYQSGTLETSQVSPECIVVTRSSGASSTAKCMSTGVSRTISGTVRTPVGTPVLYVGQRIGSVADSLTGCLVAVHNAVLSPAEIQRAYRALKQRAALKGVTVL